MWLRQYSAVLALSLVYAGWKFQAGLRSRWQHATRTAADPEGSWSVDIRGVDGSTPELRREAAAELLKYPLKENCDELSLEQRQEVASELNGARLVYAFGELHGVARELRHNYKEWLARRKENEQCPFCCGKCFVTLDDSAILAVAQARRSKGAVAAEAVAEGEPLAVQGRFNL